MVSQRLEYALIVLSCFFLSCFSYPSYLASKEGSIRYLKRQKELSEGRVLSGSFKWAPAWLQKHKSHGLYFPIVHSNVMKAATSQSSTSTSDFVAFDLGGNFLDIGGYYVTVAIGSQRQIYNLHVDTGSALSWLQCECLPGGCAQNEYLHSPLDTTASSSGSFVPCNSSLCLESNSATVGCSILNQAGSAYLTGNSSAEAILPDADSDTNCQYFIQYGDRSTTAGNLYSDVVELQFSSNVTSVPFIFGCGRKQGGIRLDGSLYFDGILGLGRSSFSLTRQLSGISSSFSICMEGNGVGGHLVLGATLNPQSSYSTPLIENGYLFYTVEIIGIALNGTQEAQSLFPIAAIVDSGTTFTYLSTSVHSFLTASILSALGNPPWVEIQRFACITLDDFLAIPDSVGDALPNLLVTLRGGSPLVIQANSFFFFARTNSVVYACLTILPTDSINIIGDSWLQNQNIVYDASNSTLYWTAVNCTTGALLGNSTQRITFPTLSTAADPLLPVPTSSTPFRNPNSPPRLSFPPPPAAGPLVIKSGSRGRKNVLQGDCWLKGGTTTAAILTLTLLLLQL